MLAEIKFGCLAQNLNYSSYKQEWGGAGGGGARFAHPLLHHNDIHACYRVCERADLAAMKRS